MCVETTRPKCLYNITGMEKQVLLILDAKMITGAWRGTATAQFSSYVAVLEIFVTVPLYRRETQYYVNELEEVIEYKFFYWLESQRENHTTQC